MMFPAPTVVHTVGGETAGNTRSAGLRGACAVCVIGKRAKLVMDGTKQG